MEKVLFLLAIVFAVLVISSRHHLNKRLADTGESQSLEENLVVGSENPASLTYAMTKISAPQNRSQVLRPQAPAPVQTKESLLKDLDKLIKDIQLSNEDSPDALQKALALTSGLDQLALRLTVLQAAQSIQGDNPTVRNSVFHEAIAVVVPENLSSDNPPPEEVAQRDLQRNVVTTAYKVYLQTVQDPDVTYNDTIEIMNYQPDPWVRRQISFEAINRFPQLREKLNGQ